MGHCMLWPKKPWQSQVPFKGWFLCPKYVCCLHHGRVWRRNLHWPSWLHFSLPARPASALFRLGLSGLGPDLPRLLTLRPSCPPCCLGRGCVERGYGKPYQQLFHQLSSLVFFLITKDQMEKVMCYSALQARNVWMWNQSVLTEILPVQRLSSSTKKTFKKTPVWSLRCLHRGK